MSSTGATSTPFEWLSGGLFFGKSSNSADKGIDSCKNVSALVDGLVENLNSLLSKEEGQEKQSEEATPDKEEIARLLALRLSRLRFLLYDERRASSQQEHHSSSIFGGGAKRAPVASDTAAELVARASLVPRLLQNLCSLPFESRKHVAAIFNYLLVCGLDGSDADLYDAPAMSVFRDYLCKSFDAIIQPLIDGHDCGAPDVALHCGGMFRSCLRHVVLYEQLVTSTQRVERYVLPFLDTFVQSPNFDVASDAMESLRVILTGGDEQAASSADGTTSEHTAAMQEFASQFLNRDYVKIFDERFNPKLLGGGDSEQNRSNYMTRRMALQILSTLLLTRANYSVMIRYVAAKANLILVMLLLRDTSPHITLDAFHVFKIFVANPNKPPEIIKILSDNKVKLCRYLETLHQDREAADVQFRDEKALVISTIQGL